MCDDVDIKSGRTRHTRYLLNFKVSERIEDSILTETLGEFPEGVQPDWRRVNTLPLGAKHSPHHVYHGAVSQIYMVGMIWQLFPFSDEAKRQVARTILGKWQADGNCFGVGQYIKNVLRTAKRKEEFDSKAIISATDLPSTRNE